MPREVVETLQPRAGGRYIDGTLGGGGHTATLLAFSWPSGRVLGLDADEAAIQEASQRFVSEGDRLTLVQANFRHLDHIAAQHGFAGCEGVVLDLGLSSDQLAATERGFSFQHDGPLDMRFDRAAGQTAADLLNESSEQELADIFFYFGEERRSRRLARQIVTQRATRPFERTSDLVEAVEAALGGRRGRLHPATRAFQALRIAVNDELGALRDGLAGAASTLGEGGRLAVITFHSLEDRIVKRFVQQRAAADEEPRLRALARKPLRPAPPEQEANPRSRSAKLRLAERLPRAPIIRSGE